MEDSANAQSRFERSPLAGKSLPKRVVSPRDMLFTFNGRIRRIDYFGYSVLAGLAWFLLSSFVPEFLPVELGLPMMVIGWLVFTWITLALGVKRLHDRSKSARWLLLGFVPLANLWLAIELAFFAGTPGANAYGPDPKTGG